MSNGPAGKPYAPKPQHDSLGRAQTAKVILHPSALIRAKAECNDRYGRIAEQSAVAVGMISTAIAGLRKIRCNTNGNAIDALMSELVLVLDEIGKPAHQILAYPEMISNLMVRLSGVSVGLEILRLSETLRHLANAPDPD